MRLHQLSWYSTSVADCSVRCFSCRRAGVFELTVLGKNGVSIDGVLFTPNSSPAPLASKVRLHWRPCDRCWAVLFLH